MAFFEGALWGGEGVPTGAGLVDRGVDQGPVPGKGWGGGGANFATCVVFLLFRTCTKKEKWRFLKAALWGGEGVPTRAGLVDGGVNEGVREGLAVGQRLGGGPRASVLGGGRW